MKIEYEFEEDIPEYALCYLVNGDDSGIEPEDKQNTDEFMEEFYTLAQEHNGNVVIDWLEEESHFTWNPAFGLACNVITCNIVILVPEDEEEEE